MATADVQVQRRHEAPEMGGMVIRTLRAIARRAGEGDAEALEVLFTLEGVVAEQLAAGVAGYHDVHRSWRKVAEVSGTSRQAMSMRFAAATIDAAHGPRCKCGMRQCPRNQLALPVEIQEVPC